MPATPVPTAVDPNSSYELGLALRRATALEPSMSLWKRPLNLERSDDVVFASTPMPEEHVAGSDERVIGDGW